MTRGALAVAAVLLAGCSQGHVGGRAADGAGSHCPDVTDVHAVTTFPQLVDAPRWAELANVEVTGGDSAVVHARVSVRERLRGEWGRTEDVRLPAEAVDEGRAERRTGARLLAFGARGEVLGLAALRRDGEAHFLGDCMDRVYRPPLQRFREIRAARGDDRTEAALLLELVRHPDGEAAAALRELARQDPRAPSPGATPGATPGG